MFRGDATDGCTRPQPSRPRQQQLFLTPSPPGFISYWLLDYSDWSFVAFFCPSGITSPLGFLSVLIGFPAKLSACRLLSACGSRVCILLSGPRPGMKKFWKLGVHCHGRAPNSKTLSQPPSPTEQGCQVQVPRVMYISPSTERARLVVESQTIDICISIYIYIHTYYIYGYM